MLLLFKKHRDTISEQTKTTTQETLEFQMNKQVEIFSSNPPINLFEESKWLLAVSCFEATNSVFIITDENNSFSITTPGYWFPRSGAETIHKLQKFLEFRSQNENELHVKENIKRRN